MDLEGFRDFWQIILEINGEINGEEINGDGSKLGNKPWRAV
jgi:hypothetical protein